MPMKAKTLHHRSPVCPSRSHRYLYTKIGKPLGTRLSIQQRSSGSFQHRADSCSQGPSSHRLCTRDEGVRDVGPCSSWRCLQKGCWEQFRISPPPPAGPNPSPCSCGLNSRYLSAKAGQALCIAAAPLACVIPHNAFATSASPCHLFTSLDHFVHSSL